MRLTLLASKLKVALLVVMEDYDFEMSIWEWRGWKPVVKRFGLYPVRHFSWLWFYVILRWPECISTKTVIRENK